MIQDLIVVLEMVWGFRRVWFFPPWPYTTGGKLCLSPPPFLRADIFFSRLWRRHLKICPSLITNEKLLLSYIYTIAIIHLYYISLIAIIRQYTSLIAIIHLYMSLLPILHQYYISLLAIRHLYISLIATIHLQLYIDVW